KGARVVRRVTVDPAACIDDHRLAATDLPVGGASVGPSGVRARSNDDLERKRLTTLVMEGLLDRPGNVALGAAYETLPAEPLEHAIRVLAGTLDRGQLVLVLDRTQAFHEPALWYGLDRAAAKNLVAGVRDVVVLEANPAGEPAGEVLQQSAASLLELDALDCACRLG